MSILSDLQHLEGKRRVAYFQKRYNAICVKNRIPLDPIVIDGDKGERTKRAIIELKKCFGVKHPNIALDNRFIAHLHSPFKRYLFRVRGQWDRGLRYRQQIRKANKAGTLAERALREAHKLVGIMEEGGNNRGAQVEAIIRANGGVVGEPWCGDGVAWCYRRAGSRFVQRGWAAAWFMGVGRKTVGKGFPGAVVAYTFQHTGIFEKYLANGTIRVIECNTGRSGAVSDSATGGDGVYVKDRSTSLVKRYVRVTG